MTIPKSLIVAMPDGDWAVPVDIIAKNRAQAYASEFAGDVSMSLAEDTEPLFLADEYEIKDWAANNMNWSDVAHVATRVPGVERTIDRQEFWMNGKKRVVKV